jgi:hypothetical protein
VQYNALAGSETCGKHQWDLAAVEEIDVLASANLFVRTEKNQNSILFFSQLVNFGNNPDRLVAVFAYINLGSHLQMGLSHGHDLCAFNRKTLGPGKNITENCALFPQTSPFA